MLWLCAMKQQLFVQLLQAKVCHHVLPHPASTTAALSNFQGEPHSNNYTCPNSWTISKWNGHFLSVGAIVVCYSTQSLELDQIRTYSVIWLSVQPLDVAVTLGWGPEAAIVPVGWVSYYTGTCFNMEDLSPSPATGEGTINNTHGTFSLFFFGGGGTGMGSSAVITGHVSAKGRRIIHNTRQIAARNVRTINHTHMTNTCKWQVNYLWYKTNLCWHSVEGWGVGGEQKGSLMLLTEQISATGEGSGCDRWPWEQLSAVQSSGTTGSPLSTPCCPLPLPPSHSSVEPQKDTHMYYNALKPTFKRPHPSSKSSLIGWMVFIKLFLQAFPWHRANTDLHFTSHWIWTYSQNNL